MLTIPTTFPQPGFYYHYKHDPYKGLRDYAYEVLGIGFHTEGDCRPEDACMVRYRPLYTSAAVYQASLQMNTPTTDLRPVSMFMEQVTKDDKTFPRFQKITNQTIITELKSVRREMYGEK